MLFKACVMAAMAAAVSAQLPTNVDPSVLVQLGTALPSSVFSVALAHPSSFASEIASSIGAGETPEWYQALPSDIKSVLASLYPASTPAMTSAAETASPSVSSSAEVTEVTSTSVTVITSAPVSSPSGTGGSSIGLNSTSISTVNTPTLSSSGSGSNGSPTPTRAPGAASLPSAAVGAGLAGLMGFLGMLVL